MQTEAEAFLTRIRAYPDDDAPRLVFADWLDEQGDPRGAFIRVQLAIAQLKAEYAAAEGSAILRADRDTNLSKLLATNRALLLAHGAEWTAPFKGLATRLIFHRGFVEEVNVEPPSLVQHAAELFAAGPLRHVRILNSSGSLAAALQCHLLSRLTALTIDNSHAGEPLAQAVSRAEHLRGLKRLSLGRSRFEDDAAEHLASSPTLAGLETLNLGENLIGESGVRALAAAPHLGALRDLELGNNRIGPAGAEALAGSERLTALDRLGLAGNEIGSPRLVTLSRAHDLLRVVALDLSNNGIGPAGLLVLLTPPAGSTDSARIRHLDLSGNLSLGDDGARILARSPRLEELRVLRLVGCGIGDEGARALAQSQHLNQLVRLDLSNNPIGNAGLREFLHSNLRSLRFLDYPSLGLSTGVRHDLDRVFRRG